MMNKLKIYFSNKKFWVWSFTLVSIATFLFYKSSHLVLHFGDGNAYVYMAKAITDGLMPYRDFFLADPPFMVFLLVPFKLLFGENLILFQALPVLFEAVTALFIFLLLKKWGNPLSFFAPLFYLFSFSTISTSDYLTGVQLVVMLSVSAIYFWEKKMPVFSGIFWALAVLTKLYALPAITGFVVAIYFGERRQELKKFAYGIVGTGLAVMTPFLISSFSKVWSYLVVHQFSRPAGLDKWYVWNFFLIRGWPILLLGFIGAFISKRRLIIFPFAMIFIFFLAYQDLYYLYLQNLAPYMTLLAFCFLGWLWRGDNDRKAFVVLILMFLGFFTWYYFGDYKNVFAKQGRFQNSDEIAVYVKSLPGKMDLYGSHEVAPLIALKSGTKLFSNYIDTNGQAFASGGLNLQTVSWEAVERGVYLISKVTDLPEYGIKDAGYESFFSKEVFGKFCKRIKDFPSTSGEQDNLIAIYRCKN